MRRSSVTRHSEAKESILPIYRFSKTVGLNRGIRAFLRVEAGATRGKTPDDIRGEKAQKLKAVRRTIRKIRRQLSQEEQQRIEQAEKLKVARRTIRKTRRRLAQKKQQLEQREMRPPSEGGSVATRDAKSHTEFGALPDFLIIGAEKAGTTFVYSALCQHPYVEPASEKEIHFFDTGKWSKKGVGWYRSQFPARAWRDGQKVITGEASPYYLPHPFSPSRASDILPNVKLIALLRNPVDRAYSAYKHKVSTGQESLSFEEALAEEENRTAGDLHEMLSDENYYSSRFRLYAYRTRGIYVDQLQRWHKYFAPNQLLVLKSEDLFVDPIGTLERVHEFLDLPKYDMSSTSLTEERNSRTYVPMAAASRQQLEKFFEPHNQRLYEYLGVDFDW
jgi:hypothetical protein